LAFGDLHQLPLGRLKTAVDDWADMADSLEKLAKEASQGMKAKSEKAVWTGVNAGVTKPFIGKTAKEFDDAAQSARGTAQVMSEGYTAFKKAQDALNKVVDEEAPARKVTVDADGTVRATHPVSESAGEGAKHDPDYQDLVRKEQGNIGYVEERIRVILVEADQADQDIAKALRINLGDDPNQFSPPKFHSTGEMKAQQAVEIARKGDKATDKELKELRTLIHENRDSPDFTTAFYKGLGPQKSVEFFADLTINTDGDTKMRTDTIKDLQKDLGFSLATATDSHNKVHLSEQWQTDLRKTGSTLIDVDPSTRSNYKPYGYQVLGNILRYGHYDQKFLTPIAEHAMQLQNDDPEIWKRSVPQGPDRGINLNPTGQGGSDGFNAMTGILEGLGHSPEASEDFFDGKMTPYSLDGEKMDKAYFEREVGGGYNSGVLDQYNLREDANGNLYLKDLRSDMGLNHEVHKDYFDLLTDKDYPWFDDRSDDIPEIGDSDAQDAYDKAGEKAQASGPDALGHALESAVTGRSYDDDSTAHTPEHSTTQAHLMHRVVERFGGDGNDLIAIKKDGNSGPFASMNDSLGNMTGDYMRDVQKAMLGGSDNISTHGVDADLTSMRDKELQNFIRGVSHDPDAYGAIVNAQQATTTDLYSEVGQHYKDGDVSQATAREDIRDLTRPGAVITGIAADARGDAIYIEKTAGDKAFNDGLSDGSKWANRAFGLVSKPLEATGVGAPLGWAVEDVQKSVTDHYTHDSADKGETAKNEYVNEQRGKSALAAREAAETAAQTAGLGKNDKADFGDSALNSFDDGYNDGSGRKN
jgi:hypothetical protein